MKDRRDTTTVTSTQPRSRSPARPTRVEWGLPPKQPDNALIAFDTHPRLSETAAKLLQIQYDDYRRAGDDDKAWRLARLSASEAAARIADELNRDDRNSENNKDDRNCEEKRKYLRETVSAELWRDPNSQRELRRVLRDHQQRDLVLASFRMAADDEPFTRAHQLAKLLIEQVELAARPIRPAEVDRLIARELERAELLRRAGGVGGFAILSEERAARLAQEHERDFRTEDDRADAMVRAAARRLVWHFAIRGDRLVAGLVGAALGREIDPRRARYVAIGR
jgi:hypothetical protein